MGKNLGHNDIFKWMLPKIIWCLFFIVPTLVGAQSFQPLFSEVEFEKGTRFLQKTTPIQDSTGNIWFGCKDGLVRYNGISPKLFHPFSRTNTLPIKKVLKPLFGRNQGEIIVYNWTKVFVLKVSENESHPISYALPEAIKDNFSINQIVKDAEQTLWMTIIHKANKRTTIFLFQSKDYQSFNLVNQFSFEADPLHMDFLSVNEGYVFLNSNQSILQLNKQGEIIKNIPFPKAYPGGHYMDEAGTFWVISKTKAIGIRRAKYEESNFMTIEPAKTAIHEFGVYFLEKSSDSLYRLPIKNPEALLTTFRLRVEPDRIYTYGNGFSILDRKTLRAHNFAPDIKAQIQGNQMYREIFLDVSGIYWLVSSNFILMEPSNQIDHYLNDASNCNNKVCIVRNITEDDSGHIFFNGYWGLHQLNTETQSVQKMMDMIEPWGLTWHENQLYVDNYTFDLSTKEKFIVLGEKRQQTGSCADKEGNIWFGLYGGTFDIYNPQDQSLKKFTALEEMLPGQEMFFNSFFPQTSGKGMWVVTENHGLYLVHKDDGILSQYQFDANNEHSLLSGNLHCATEDSAGNLWIGSSEGLSFLDRKRDRFTHFQKEDGLPASNVFSMIYEADSGLWLGTNNGLSFYDFSTQQFANFSTENGLINTEYNRLAVLKSKSGKMYFGGTKGVDAFYPKDLLTSPLNTNTPIILTQINQFDGNKNQKINRGLESMTALQLEAQNQYFELQFKLAYFPSNAKTVYQYKLEGYDQDWSLPSSQTTLRYENMPPGTYHLRVRGSLSPTVWNEKELKIKIVKAQFWYKTTWATILFMTIGFATIFMVYRAQMKRRLEREEARRIKELDALKTKLYTNITHEFRTPLTVIQGMSDQIRNNEEVREVIRRNSKNLLHLVTQLLDMSKLESQKMKLNLVQRNIVSYIRYLTKSFESYADTKHIQLTFYSELDELMMDYDPEKIQHIIANLLSNAIKFTQEKGEIIVHLSKNQLQTRQSSSEILRIKVQDNGMGILEKHMPHIFDRFYQVDDSPTRRGEGTGIGLALAKELVELMDGTITVESELGQGTVFKILLPIRSTALPGRAPFEDKMVFANKKTESSQISIDSTSADPALESRATVPQLLIIEDNTDVARYIQICLEDQYQINFAKDGKEGIEKAIELIPDIIISDLMMPEKDGFEVCNTLKNDERTSHIPIILLTAKADVESKITGLERGADAYLTKPFDKKELLIRLKKLIELRRKLQSRYAGGLLPSRSEDKGLQIEDAFLKKVRDILMEHLDDAAFDVPQLCKKMGLSRSQLYRKIKALTDQSIVAYISKIRLQKAVELLQSSDMTVSEVAYEVGFTDPAYFSRAFSKAFGKAPIDVKK